MSVLGVDPGLQHTGLCLVVDGVPTSVETISTKPLAHLTKRQQVEERDTRIAHIAEQVANAIAAARPDVVAIEEPYHAAWVRGKEANAKAQDARTLWQLVAAFREAAGRAGAAVVMVAPSDGFQALTGAPGGDKGRHVWFANQHLRRAGLPPLRLTEDHVADALGVALRGEAVTKARARGVAQ